MARKTRASSPASIERKLKAAKALELRLASKTWAEIAAAVGYANAAGAYKSVMQLMSELPAENLQEFRSVEVPRLEKLRAELYPLAPRDKDCLNGYLQLTDRIHRAMGLSNKLEVTGRDGGPITVVTGVPQPEPEPPKEAAAE